jgi:hypothetical protein
VEALLAEVAHSVACPEMAAVGSHQNPRIRHVDVVVMLEVVLMRVEVLSR